VVLGRVVGTVVASRKEPKADGWKLLLVQPLDAGGSEVGSPVVAADAVGAGEEEIVLVASGSSARQTRVTDQRPCDAVVMAIVDSWDVMGDVRYRKNADGKDHGS
jgi:microcompartment protein CcmK/EutM